MQPQPIQSNKNIEFRFMIKFLFFFATFIIFFFFSRENIDAQTCNYYTDAPCQIYDTDGDGINDQCTVPSEYHIVDCTPQGAGSCPDGQSGIRCDYSFYQDIIRYCDWGATGYFCTPPQIYNVGPGYCGCNPGGGGGGDDNPPPPPPQCDCGSCNWVCYDEDQSSSTIECAGNPVCDGDGDGIGYACRPNCCGPTCEPPPCTCTPSCTNPSGLSFTSPADGATIQPGVTINWQLNNWGFDSNQAACNNNQCPYQGYSGNGTYKLFMGGINISEYCVSHQGSGASAYLTTNSCTLLTYLPSWPGTTQNFTVTAYNNCGQASANRTFSWAPNQKPFCSTLNISSVQGRYANGLYGVRENEQFTLTATGGDSDPYGNPGFIQLCYALRGQPESWYRNGPSVWSCIGQSTNSTTYSVSRSFAQLRSGYNPTIQPPNGPANLDDNIDQNGFVVTTNVRDNVTSNFCSTNVGYLNGSGVYWPQYPPETCNGGSCVLNIHNNAPELNSVGAPSGWIGTEPDSDNGLSCQDNNPATYTAQFTDIDDSTDIDRIDFQIGTAAQLADANNDNILDNPDLERNYPLRIIFAKKMEADGDQEFANGTFFIRDTQVISNNASTRRCYDQSRGLHLIDPTGWDTSNPSISRNARLTQPYTVWCYGYDGHSWDDVTLLTNQTLNGVSVDVYYLRNDLEVYGEGYIARLDGQTSNWQQTSYVAYERNGGDRVWTQFIVQYLPDGSTDRWGGTYRNAWAVFDQLGKDDDTENLAGEYMAANQWDANLHIIGQTRIDLTAPVIDPDDPSTPPTIDPPTPISATRLRVFWETSDTRSGLNRTYGEADMTSSPVISDIFYHPGNIAYTPGTDTPFGPQHLWNRAISGNSQAGSETVDIGANEEGTIHFDLYAQDNACNLSNDTSQVSLSTPWILTKGGLSYSDESPDIDIKPLGTSGHPNSDPIGSPTSQEFTTYPFNINRWEVGLSSELLFSNQSVSASQNLPYRSLTSAFSLQNYANANNTLWYQNLREEAESEMATRPLEFNRIVGFSGNLGGNVSSIAQGSVNCNDGTKLCVIEATDININNSANPLVCNRKTAFFITGNLIINSNITASGNANGCIFIVQGNVTIQKGSYKSGGSAYPVYDLIEGFIISDGVIHIEEDSDGSDTGYRDGLKIRGSILGFGPASGVFESSITFERSMKLLDNLTYPAVVLHHDSRYYEIAEEIMGGDNETYKTEVGFEAD